MSLSLLQSSVSYIDDHGSCACWLADAARKNTAGIHRVGEAGYVCDALALATRAQPAVFPRSGLRWGEMR